MIPRFLPSLLLSLSLTFSFAQKASKTKTPSWVKDVSASLQESSNKSLSGGFYYLLLDRQLNLISQEKFSRNIFKILTSDGIQEMSDITIDFDPEFEQLSFHSINVHRNGEIINKLQTTEIKTVQREQSLERHLYDGSLTAYINLSDVRIGDVVEYSYTIKGHNPVFKNHFSQYYYFEYGIPYQKMSVRAIIPTSKEFHIYYRNGEVKPDILESNGKKEYLWVLENVDALLVDNYSPGWYDPYRYLVISDFANWAEVNTWALQQFVVTNQQIERVKKGLPSELFEGTLDDRILKTVRFIQDDLRYLGFENGVHSHQPHSPDQILKQRFGDCKDKSLLLVIVARIHGIEAYPVLVNTSIRHKIDEEPPTYFGFNHCVVQLQYNNQTMYIDPTINNQGGLIDNLYFPSYGKGLVVKETTTDFTALPEPTSFGVTEEQFFEITEIDSDAKLTVRTVYTGKNADAQRGEIYNVNIETTQKNYLNYYGNMYPEIAVDKALEIVDDREANTLAISEYYIISNFWKTGDSPEKISCEFYPQTLEQYINIEKSLQRKAPYQLTYPLSYSHTTKINLPEPWNAKNEDVEISSDYYTYLYKVKSKDDQITITHTYKTHAPEIPLDGIRKFVNDHQKIIDKSTYMLYYDKSFSTESRADSAPIQFIVIIVALAIGAFMVLRIYKMNPVSKSDYDLSIGGWLILPAIGICISPITVLTGLLNPENNFFNQGVWSGLYNTQQYGLLALITIELLYNIVYLFFLGLIILLFFQRRTSLPILIVIFYGVSFVGISLDSIAASILTETPLSENYLDMVKALIPAAIWIPYFLNSERVKNTFTQRL